MSEIKKIATRESYARTITEFAKENDNLVVLDAGLAGATKTCEFKKVFPDRFFDCGIAEQNMIGIAAGMSTMGKIPFAYSFGPFATRRCYDQIFISVAYARQNVKIVGTDPGVLAEYNGGTHMPFEDMALMRAIPHMVCFEPVDATMLEKAVDQIVDYQGAVYIRLQRKKAEKVFDDTLNFELVKAI